MIDPPAAGRVEERLVDAVLRCVARWGVAKTTMDDVAREAGCSRATLYRSFPGGKDALLAGVVDVEVDRLLAAVGRALDGADDVENALVAAVSEAARRVHGHAALRFLLRHEPATVLAQLAFHRLDALLARARSFVGPRLERFLGDPVEAARTAEWVTRIGLSYTFSPAPGVHLTDPESVRRLVRAFVLPGLAARSTV